MLLYSNYPCFQVMWKQYVIFIHHHWTTSLGRFGGGEQDMIIVLTTKIKILHWWSLVWHYYATCTVLHTSKNICAACSLDLFPLCTSFLILRGWGPSCTLVLRILSVSEVPTTSSSSLHSISSLVCHLPAISTSWTLTCFHPLKPALNSIIST